MPLLKIMLQERAKEPHQQRHRSPGNAGACSDIRFTIGGFVIEAKFIAVRAVLRDVCLPFLQELSHVPK
jgi:hypothetical protein